MVMYTLRQPEVGSAGYKKVRVIFSGDPLNGLSLSEWILREVISYRNNNCCDDMGILLFFSYSTGVYEGVRGV